MLRHLTGSAITNSVGVSHQPGAGYKWNILYVLATLNTSATAGTRSLRIGLTPPVSAGSTCTDIAFTGLQTAVSSTFDTAMIPSAAQASTNDTLWNLMSALVIDSLTVISVIPTLVAGDSYTYDILVNEVIDD